MSIRKICGIYSITHIESGKKYIGQSQAIGDRWISHRSALRREKHPNRKLQNAWTKYGEQAFRFDILEKVSLDEEALCRAEQQWMVRLNPYYNLAPVGGTTRGLKHPPRSQEFRRRMSKISKGRRHSQETIELLKQRQAANPYRPSQAHREKMRLFMTGRKKSPESVAKTRAANLGRKQPPEEIARRSAALKGHFVSTETRRKIGAANSVRLLGIKQSPETIAKRAASLRGKERPLVGEKLRGRKRPDHVLSALRAANDARFSERRERIRTAVLADPFASAASIARQLGVNRDTVRKYKQELLAA